MTTEPVQASADVEIRLDSKKLDRLMDLSGELVIIRSQYARTERMLQRDLARQKQLAQRMAAGRALLETALKEPAKQQKALVDLGRMLEQAAALAGIDEFGRYLQDMGHTTGALEKASSELQSGIVRLKSEVSGGDGGAAAMAIVPALLVVVGQEICAFPLSAVTEIVNVSSKDIYYVDGNATMKLREHALSLVELSKIIQFEANAQTADDTRRVVIISCGLSRLGVIVDSLLGKDEIVLKPLTRHFASVKGIVGASILADGNVALILDPAVIIAQSS